jgi:hypothetical protein
METIGEEWIPRLKELFTRMDETYSALAAQVDFSCSGCDGSKCCEVDLIVHTFAERLYLRRGFYSLSLMQQKEIVSRCRRVLEAKRANPIGEAYRSSVCVLNVDGLCSVYQYRPMICRLAGIQHFFVRPDGSEISGKGCPTYEDTIASRFPGTSIDRTEFYKEMARIEIDIVNELGKRPDPLTIAEILCIDLS